MLILVLLFLIIITFLYLYFKKDNYLEYKVKNVVHEDFTVPKIIHQIWFQGYDNLGKEMKDLIKHNLELNPGWKYMFWDENKINDFIKNNEDSYVYEAYMKINPVFKAMKSDLARYIIINHFGGVYLDIKVKILNKLDSFIDNSKFNISDGLLFFHPIPSFLKYNKGYEYSQFSIISPKHFHLIRILINEVCNNIYNYDKLDFLIKTLSNKGKILYISGPIIYTKVLNIYFKNFKDKVKYFKSNGVNGSIYINNMIFDGTNGFYYKFQNNKDNKYSSDKYKNEKIIL